jgi:CBS domain containing-hemolysin-like protein
MILAMSTTEWAMLATIVVLLLVSVFLAMAETALTRMTRSKAQALADDNRWGANRLLELVSHPERFLNGVLLVVLVCQLVQATLTGVLADRLFGPWGIAVATFVNVVLVFVLAEAAPKTWAIEHPEQAALVAAPPVAAMVRFWPLRIISRGLIGLTNVILPGKGLKEGPFVSEEELLALADVAVEEEVIDAEERELIEQIIEFGDTIVREVMVPRPDMLSIDADFRVADAMEVVLMNGRSRVPVCGDGIDDIVGIAYAKDLMRAGRDGGDGAPVSEVVRAAHFVPETKRIAQLLPEMQARKFHMAIVVDEYGGTAGLVTLEDLLEELVGEIVDEFDREDPMIEPQADGSVKVQARMAIDEVNDLLRSELPEGDWDTIGGLMFHLLGHVPDEGETTTCDGHLLTAEQVQGRRIGVVRVERMDAADGGAGDDDHTTRGRSRGRNHDAGDRHDTEAAQ